VLADALYRLGDWVQFDGVNTQGRYRGARDLLLRLPPRLAGAGSVLLGDEESTVDAAKRIASLLDESVLPIQGPPGAGKTYSGARMMCELIRQGKKVGITAVSHKVIRNLLDEVVLAAQEFDIEGLQCIQRVSEEPELAVPGITFATDNAEPLSALRAGAQVVAGTPWLWSRQDYFEAVDVLFVDEAGQMSLANVLAVVAADCNQLAHATPACMVALAIEHEVDRFCRLRPHESMVEIGPRTQGEIGETVQRIPRRLRVDRGECSAVPGVHRLEQVVAAFITDFAHDDPVGTMAQSGGQ
jgi:hypothetical protein